MNETSQLMLLHLPALYSKPIHTSVNSVSLRNPVPDYPLNSEKDPLKSISKYIDNKQSIDNTSLTQQNTTASS